MFIRLFAFVALFSVFTAASSADHSSHNGFTCWSGDGIAFGEDGVTFGNFTKMKCPSKAKGCFSASYITLHEGIFAHKKGCADENGCSIDAMFTDWNGIIRETNCNICYKSGCNKRGKVTLEFQLGEIECDSELDGELWKYVEENSSNDLEKYEDEGEERAKEGKLGTMHLASKRMRCSEHSKWCLSAKCVPKQTEKFNEHSFLAFKGCALPKTTKASIGLLCATLMDVAAEVEHFRILPGTKIEPDTTGKHSNGTTASVSIEF